MKTDFATLIKSMRQALRADFKKLESIKDQEHSDLLESIEARSSQMIVDGGYTEEEFYTLYQDYFMDFSSENPDEWVVKHDPENAQVISG